MFGMAYESWAVLMSHIGGHTWAVFPPCLYPHPPKGLGCKGEGEGEGEGEG
jgi:hypothetical protein